MQETEYVMCHAMTHRVDDCKICEDCYLRLPHFCKNALQHIGDVFNNILKFLTTLYDKTMLFSQVHARFFSAYLACFPQLKLKLRIKNMAN